MEKNYISYTISRLISCMFKDILHIIVSVSECFGMTFLCSEDLKSNDFQVVTLDFCVVCQILVVF
jgi:hypothetical protein